MKTATMILATALAMASQPVSGSVPPGDAGADTQSAGQAASPAAKTAEPTTLILLGTGAGPGAKVARAGIASLLRVAGKVYLVDAGDGVGRQLARVGVPERSINTIFLTHLHDDHTAGLPGLLTFAYTLRTKGVEVIGPPDTPQLMNGVLAFLQTNAEIRMAEQYAPPTATLIRARAVGEGEIFSDGTVTVTAVKNAHYHFASSPTSGHQSYSYRFKTPDKVIVFTGDTGPSKAVENLAKGADILVAEMISPADVARVPPDIAAHMVRDHLSPSQVGQLAANAKVGMLVLSHIQTVSEKDVAEIRKFFSGRIVVGADLDQFGTQ